jgi:glycosyltransferase involved in cell wall biosynthesis
MTRLPRRWRPAITLTVIDCTLAPNLLGREPADTYEQQVLDAHRLYARWTQPDGVLSWYQAFTAAARQLRIFTRSHVVAARFCFTDPERFHPAPKQRLIVWAGRLSTQKRPLLFVDAIAELCRQSPELVEGWRFEMYGGGVLEEEVRARIRAHGLQDRLTLTRAPDLAPVFAISSLFVSTQAYENFTSLAMLEAMSAGNAVVGEAVGQTAEFVHHGANGFAVAATPPAFAEAIAEYLRHPARHAEMARQSRALATDVHTIEHFADDTRAFWAAVASR